MFLQNLSVHDAERMLSLLKEGFSESRWSSTDLRKFLNLTTCKAWGCFKEGELIAFMLIQASVDEAEILLLVTHPLHRQRGIARALLQAATTHLKQKTIARFFLEVSVENDRAISFYKRNKFQIVAIRENYYNRKVNKAAYIMALNI